jgi:Xaa-Pro aminopeptidase
MIDVNSARRGKYTNIERLTKTIADGPYDAVIVMSHENIPYYSGFYNMDLRFIPERMHFVVWPRDGEPSFVVTEVRARYLQPGDTFLTDIVTYEGEGLDSVRAVAETLAKQGVTKGRVGIEGRNFPGAHLLELQRRCPEIEFVDAFAFLESPRLIKTPAEVELLTTLAGWTTAAIDTAFGAAQIGDTERSIAARMQYELLKNGADLIAAPVFGAGQRAGAFHPIATDQPVESGMMVYTDFGGYLSGYYSDVARTAVMGKATDRQRDLYAKVWEIKDRIVEYIQPGMPVSEVARHGRKLYADRGLEYKWSIIGHSIGLGIHESPQIYPWFDEPILPGMVMMIELGYHDYPSDGIHVEDMVVITDSGAEYRSDFSKHQTLWELGG